MDLKNKVVLLTGASRGLGKEIAIKLAQRGARLALVARAIDELDNLAVDLDTEVLTIQCDLRKFEDLGEAVKKTLDKFGTIDILINNAGIWYEGSTIDHPDEKIEELFRLNTIAPIILTKKVLPTFLKNKSGQIFNVLSVAGRGPSGGWGVYCGTKYGLRGFGESLQEELSGSGVRVTNFYPGGMNTSIFRDSGFAKGGENEKAPWMMDKVNVAEIVVFMLSQPEELQISDLRVVKT